jgi:hypothetical protein
MRLQYNVTPLAAVHEARITNDFVVNDQRVSFWDFLSLPLERQLNTLAFLWLRRKFVIRNRATKEYLVEFKTLDTDDILKTIQEHVVAYINATSQEPTRIIIGSRQYYYDLPHSVSYSQCIKYSTYSTHDPSQILLRMFNLEVTISPFLDGFFLE